MDPIFGGALVSAGAGLFGDLMGLGRQTQLQHEAWKREDTAVQRRVKDLRAAGLSPTLAAGSAAGSSAPINVMGQFSQAGERVGEAISGALELKAQKIGLRKLDAEAGRTEADRRRAEAQAMLAEIHAEAFKDEYWRGKLRGSHQAGVLSEIEKARSAGYRANMDMIQDAIAREYGLRGAGAATKLRELEEALLRKESELGRGSARGVQNWVHAVVPLLQLIMR